MKSLLLFATVNAILVDEAQSYRHCKIRVFVFLCEIRLPVWVVRYSFTESFTATVTVAFALPFETDAFLSSDLENSAGPH
ncbi:hypothetical protein [Butyrivibrio sp. FCS014]|uniref:hypothetical protein n=1 Tax=Butyrivibrio sp. FCS014 TaxID=1408304 RepID=UPI000466E5F9|nr:hypothetical protein [Butyrivibrio sp. FCS014]